MVQNSFVFYDSFRDAVEDMDDKDRLAFYEAIINYSLDGKPPDELSKELVRMFKLVKPQLDANTKRKKDGKKGGRPSKKDSENLSNNYDKPMVSEEENYKKTSGFENKNHRLKNKKPNVNVNDNVNVNVNANVNVNVLEFAEQEFGRTLSSSEVEFINSWKYNPEIIKLAIKETVLNQVYNVKYTDKILYEWEKANLKDVNSIKKHLKKRKEQQSEDNEGYHYRRLE